MLLNCGVGEDSWESLGLQRSNQSLLKEISPGCSLEGLMLKLKLQYFGHLIRRVDSLEKTLMLEGLGAGGEGDDRMKWLVSITDSMDVCLVNSGSWWWTGRPGVLRFMGSQSCTRLSNWTELMGPDAMILVFWMLSFKPTFSLSSFTFTKWFLSFPLLSATRVVSSAYLKLLIFLLAIFIDLILLLNGLQVWSAEIYLMVFLSFDLILFLYHKYWNHPSPEITEALLSFLQLSTPRNFLPKVSGIL